MDYEEIYDRFGISSLKNFQKETLDALLTHRKDVYLSIKTGGGKSVCYEAFPLMWKNLHSQDCKVLVVSPLISIMKEQSEHLNSLGFKATYIGKEKDDAGILNGEYQFLFTSPESILAVDKWRQMLTSEAYKDVELFVVDEAHTVLQWGESAGGDAPFREWYGNLGEVRSLVECPVLLITATANEASRIKLRRKFSMRNYTEIIDNPDRENVKLFVKKVKSTLPLSDVFEYLLDSLKESKESHPRYIIFCTSIKACADMYSVFRLNLKENIKYVQMFHSKTSDQVKEDIKSSMKSADGQVRILIATSAAGMGVNFTNLNNVINFGPPKDMDSFVQQIGRAGRGHSVKANALLLYTARQCKNLDSDMIKYMKNVDQCRRKVMLSAYNAKPNEKMEGHFCCDICSTSCKCNERDCQSFEHPLNTFMTTQLLNDSSEDSDYDHEDGLDMDFVFS